MTNPDILKMEKLGMTVGDSVEKFLCFGCRCLILFEENEYAFDRFGRLFCCVECRTKMSGGFK